MVLLYAVKEWANAAYKVLIRTATDMTMKANVS